MIQPKENELKIPNQRKVEIFQEELDRISDPELKLFATEVLKQLPDYFFTVSVSSTGKYHPEFASGEGGLVRHTKAALIVAEKLFENTTVKELQLTEHEKDLARVSILLHDGCKRGDDENGPTLHDHPNIIVRHIQQFQDELPPILVIDLDQILMAISSHSGQWTTSKYSYIKLDRPESNLDKVVHISDYIASLKIEPQH